MTDPVTVLLESLEGIQVPGGCDCSDSWQTVTRRTDGLLEIRVSHDSLCARDLHDGTHQAYVGTKRREQRMSEIEHANVRRGLDTFPSGWGFPPGSTYSEERAAWVQRHALVEKCNGERRRFARDMKREYDASPGDALQAMRLTRALADSQ